MSKTLTIENFLNALNDVEDRFVEESDPEKFRQDEPVKELSHKSFLHQRNIQVWMRNALICAACVGIAFLGYRMIPLREGKQPEAFSEREGSEWSENLGQAENSGQAETSGQTENSGQTETLGQSGNEADIHVQNGEKQKEYASDRRKILTILPEKGEGMGFEGVCYFDESEFEIGYLSAENSKFDTLPVYKNGVFAEGGIPGTLPKEEREKKIRDAATALGLENVSFEEAGYTGGRQTNAKAEGVSFACYGDGTLSIFFDTPLKLSEKYRDLDQDTSSEEVLKEMLLDLAEQYSDLFQMEAPQVLIEADRSFDGTMGRRFYLFDAGEDDVQDLLNSAFRLVQIGFSSSEGVHVIHLNDYLVGAEKIGDYPLISVDHAKELLSEGKYFTSVPYDVDFEKDIVRCELTYKVSFAQEVLIPYYRFWVEIRDPGLNFAGSEIGLKTFGAFYVPAVAEEYLAIKNFSDF